MELEADTVKTLNITTKSVKYSFKIKNYNNIEQINNLNMEYYIQIVSDKLDLFQINLYKGNEKLELNNYKTKTIAFPTKVKKEQEYTLEVVVPETINENIDSNIKIKVYFNQKI